MKLFKHKENGMTMEVEDFVADAMERFGYVEITVEADEELVELRAKGKELSIKGAHNMKKETLLEKIAEATK